MDRMLADGLFPNGWHSSTVGRSARIAGAHEFVSVRRRRKPDQNLARKANRLYKRCTKFELSSTAGCACAVYTNSFFDFVPVKN